MANMNPQTDGTASAALQFWGGVECTVNRVGDRYFDQVRRSGHVYRASDLDRISELGLKTLRYPVLWEHTAPECPEDFDWSRQDLRMARLKELGISPVAGLVHHGSGPKYTNLLDPHFPEKLAFYAKAVATRYPWIEQYTPVNEPLTTARFSCLYGHWYPHRCDSLSMLQALLNQMKATVLSMEAIRQVNPGAKLVQTEDLGFVQSTKKLAYQARFENLRRWLTWDLLCGKVDRSHQLWKWIIAKGIMERDLEWFLRNPCPPDVIGINYYVTSERFLDENREPYPEHSHGGNGKHCYADIETVRLGDTEPIGAKQILIQAWQRYRIPMAITEAHLGCTHEEQCRWLRYIWDEANGAYREGADVRAVTVWSLLGSYDWNSLLTQNMGHYESGAFDVRGGMPRPTALAAEVKRIAGGEELAEREKGWWERPVRAIYRNVEETYDSEGYSRAPRPILITGATGTLGRSFARICELRGLSYRLLSRAEMDIADSASVRAALREHKPWALINTAGYVRVDDAEREEELCLRENTQGPAILSAECAERSLKLVTFSSDLVFDGKLGWRYVESDRPSPLNAYGRSKAAAEQIVRERHPDALVVRTGAFFGPWDRHNFAWAVLEALSQGKRFVAAEDQRVSPTYVPDLVNATLDLLQDGMTGIWHLANRGEVSWAEFARLVAKVFEMDAELICGQPGTELGQIAPRPLLAALASEKGSPMRGLEDAVLRFKAELDPSLVLASQGEGVRAYMH